MGDWNFADVWETVAATAGDRCAQIHGDRRTTWSEFDRRAGGVAATLIGEGLERQATVATLLYNAPEFMETVFGAYKAALVPVNTNHRYGPDELEHLWTDADAAAVVFHGSLTEAVAKTRPRVPDVRAWLHVDDGSEPCPGWAIPYEQAAPADPAPAPWGRSGDDLLLIYTGGTTGRPKGVMWRQHDMYRASDTARDGAEFDRAAVQKRLEAGKPPPPIGIPAAPLMHGTGFVFGGTLLSRGGTIVTLESRKFDVEELLDTITRERVTALCIVGEAFGRPIADALDADPDRYDVTSLDAVSSSGMAWTAKSKQRLLEHAEGAVLIDMLNSSEASGMGRSVTSKKKAADPSKFRLGSSAFVVDDDLKPVEAGSGVVGRVAVRGHLPLGYHKDPEKTAETFPEVEGVRCSLPGDLATVEEDGSITLLGRGSTCINTGGEKVFPEEVEDVLRDHPDIADAIVVGVPDDRFGEVVAALVQPRAGTSPEADALIEHARAALARYKAPRHVLLADDIGRGANGKPDIPGAKRRVEEWLSDVRA